MKITLMIVPVYLAGPSSEAFTVRAMRKSYPQPTDLLFDLDGTKNLVAFLRQIASEETVEMLWMPHVHARAPFNIRCGVEQWPRVQRWLVMADGRNGLTACDGADGGD